jgi:transposase-like protein
MPWKETNVMQLKTEFAIRSMLNTIPFRSLCREYGISTKTGYKWKQRFIHEYPNGLQERSRRPLSSPTQIGEDVICEIVKLKGTQ